MAAARFLDVFEGKKKEKKRKENAVETKTVSLLGLSEYCEIIEIIIQYIDTLPKYWKNNCRFSLVHVTYIQRYT